MARVATPLTDKQLKNAKPKSGEYVLSDGEGLQCRIMPSSTKSWRFVYKQSRLTLGSYPSLSIENARKVAREQRELVAQSIDPKAYKLEKKSEYIAIYQNTLLNVSKEWFDIKKTGITDDIWRSLVLHIFPYIQDKTSNGQRK